MAPRIHIPKVLKEFARQFENAGFSVYFVGGAVRDSLLGLKPKDWDAATSARPEDVIPLFKKVIPTGIEHGTVTVLWKNTRIETTTFRTDGDYLDGRHPGAVSFTDDLHSDLSRRDFTINGMAAHPVSGRIIDPQGGMNDLKNRTVRAIGDAIERFSEDGLRPLRAIRFACRLDFEIEEKTEKAITLTHENFRKVSLERVRDELVHILLSPNPARGFWLLDRTGLLPLILPELASCKGVKQGRRHIYDVFEHSIMACQASPPELELRLAGLLHDIGKPGCRVENASDEHNFDGSGLHFHGHDGHGAKLAEILLKRLRFSNTIVEKVALLIKAHMFDYSEDSSDAALRRFASRLGMDNIRELVKLRLADLEAVTGQKPSPLIYKGMLERLEKLTGKDAALSIKSLAIGGNELAAMGWPRGPAMGLVLKELLDTVLEDPSLNSPERLLEIAGRLKEKYGVGGKAQL